MNCQGLISGKIVFSFLRGGLTDNLFVSVSLVRHHFKGQPDKANRCLFLLGELAFHWGND